MPFQFNQKSFSSIENKGFQNLKMNVNSDTINTTDPSEADEDTPSNKENRIK